MYVYWFIVRPCLYSLQLYSNAVYTHMYINIYTCSLTPQPLYAYLPLYQQQVEEIKVDWPPPADGDGTADDQDRWYHLIVNVRQETAHFIFSGLTTHQQR